MTDKRLTWADGDVLYSADLKEGFAQNYYCKLLTVLPYDDGAAQIQGIVAHNSTTYSAIDNKGSVYQTSDSGVTWTIKNTDLGYASFIMKCKNDFTKAVVIEGVVTPNQKVVYTSNSGATWTTCTGTGTFVAALYDVSFPTVNLIVLAGDDDVGAKHITYSTDQGANFVDAATSPSSRVYSVDMFSSGTGYAIDSAKNIWKTTNNAIDWVDTGHNVIQTLDAGSKICAITDTECYIMGASGRIEYYNHPAGTVVTITDSGQAGDCISGGIFKSTEGKYIVARLPDNVNTGMTNILFSTGTTNWSMFSIPSTLGNAGPTYKTCIDACGSSEVLACLGYGAIRTLIP